ncbi:YdeI/OmpD-associated family protein [Bdellovibrio bacteriovorus]|uniref:YdeI/OmpD-associated family protein n=1 Tax=Bdellovibrio bacteriovorus TaxID=959 RepID=UPI003D075C65
MSGKNAKVDAFIQSEKKWKEEVQLLRQIALDSGLSEDFKWSLPCYLHEDKNIAIIQNFKNSCALMFFQGSELKDSKKLLKSPGANSQSAKRFEFTSVADITKVKAAIRAYIKEAVKISEAEVKTQKKPAKMPALPAELKQALDKNKKLKAAFEKLTPGRQRLYLMHITSAKQAATRVSRVEKCIPRILQGLGLNDRP